MPSRRGAGTAGRRFRGRGLACVGGAESAVADYFPNAPVATPGSVGKPTPERAALELLIFGRDFDADAYEGGSVLRRRGLGDA